MIIFCDVDNTLLLMSGVNKPLVKRLNQLSESGDTLILFTARPKFMIKDALFILDKAGLSYDGFILSKFPHSVASKNNFIKQLEGESAIILIDDEKDIRACATSKGWSAFAPEEFVKRI